MSCENSAHGPLVLVTGAASGIGLAVVRQLSREGRRVVASDVRADALRDAVEALRAPGFTKVHAEPFDVRVADEVEHGVARIEAQHGPITGLVHAAGVLRVGSATAVDVGDLQACVEVNLGGVFHVTRAVGARMQRRREGSIVVIASNAAHTPRLELAAYAASKAAAVMFAKCLGLELASHGVRCNVISPGSTDTPMLRALWGSAGSDGSVRGAPSSYRLGIPLGRVATPDDVAEAALFLLSTRARHITLQELTVDGGATL